MRAALILAALLWPGVAAAQAVVAACYADPTERYGHRVLGAGGERWSCFFDQFAALLRWIRGHAARAHHPDDDQAERLQTALAQIDLRAQNTHEGDYRRVGHWTFPWSESSSKPHPAALSQPCVV